MQPCTPLEITVFSNSDSRTTFYYALWKCCYFTSTYCAEKNAGNMNPQGLPRVKRCFQDRLLGNIGLLIGKWTFFKSCRRSKVQWFWFFFFQIFRDFGIKRNLSYSIPPGKCIAIICSVWEILLKTGLTTRERGSTSMRTVSGLARSRPIWICVKFSTLRTATCAVDLKTTISA